MRSKADTRSANWVDVNGSLVALRWDAIKCNEAEQESIFSLIEFDAFDKRNQLAHAD